MRMRDACHAGSSGSDLPWRATFKGNISLFVCEEEVWKELHLLKPLARMLRLTKWSNGLDAFNWA